MKLNLISIAVLAAFGASTGAQADLFSFDPAGTGSTTINNAAIIDQSVGNALAVGGVTAIQNYLTGSGSTGFTLYYQANLNSVQDADGNNLFSNGAGGQYFTFVGGFGETVTSAAANNSATFAFDASNPVNFFTMYATNALGSNLTGNGFATGTPILTGHVVAIPSSAFTISSTDPINLDASPNGDQWGGQDTVSGSGASNITLRVDSVNTNYFPSLDPLNDLVLSFFNTSQLDPYNQVDPSRCFNTDTLDCTTTSTGGIIPTIGAVNGSNGPDFLFQADGNQSVTVPEPGTVALLGLGLAMLGMGASRRRAS